MGTLCLSGACLLKAGENVSSDFTGSDAETNWNALILQAEAYINCVSRYNWVDNYASLNADVKYILEDAAACHAACSAISYDMSGFTSRAEAQTMLDVNWAKLQDYINLLKDRKFIDYINSA